MPLVSDRCICLSKTEYSETSQIVTLLSRRYGTTRVIAKGAHRRTKAGASRFDGGVDLLDIGDAVFSHDPARDLVPLTEWKLRDGHLELRRSLRGIYLGLFAAELVARLIEEHDPHPELFDGLERTLPDMADSRREEVFLAFEIELLRECGYLSELFNCLECGAGIDEHGPAYFSAERGGVVCRDCEALLPDRQSIDPRLLRLLQSFVLLPRSNGAARRLPQLTRRQTDPINRLFVDQVQHTLGRRLRVARYVLG